MSTFFQNLFVPIATAAAKVSILCSVKLKKVSPSLLDCVTLLTKKRLKIRKKIACAY